MQNSSGLFFICQFNFSSLLLLPCLDERETRVVQSMSSIKNIIIIICFPFYLFSYSILSTYTLSTFFLSVVSSTYQDCQRRRRKSLIAWATKKAKKALDLPKKKKEKIHYISQVWSKVSLLSSKIHKNNLNCKCQLRFFKLYLVKRVYELTFNTTKKGKFLPL